MTYAIVRKDLRESGEYPSLATPYGALHINVSSWFNMNAIYESAQPECWNNEEFNLALFVREQETNIIYLSNSIDFDFYQTIEQAREALNE